MDGQRRGYCSQIGFMFVTTNRLKIDHVHAETLAELLAWQVEGQLTIKYL